MTTDCLRPAAILLLGPTGAGKTPLGELLERRGLPGRRCLHFDFGATLRDVVERDAADVILSRADVDFLRGVLESGALLEERAFSIAERLLRSFLARRDAAGQCVIVLNGLPRHVGQARALEPLLDVRLVVSLACTEETVLQRIASNVGGDRGRRNDDSREAVRRKLEIFSQRTAPLLDYYRSRGTPLRQIEVRAETSAEEMWREVAGCQVPTDRNPWA
jgi:adenylate kinase family enzyme